MADQVKLDEWMVKNFMAGLARLPGGTAVDVSISIAANQAVGDAEETIALAAAARVLAVRGERWLQRHYTQAWLGSISPIERLFALAVRTYAEWTTQSQIIEGWCLPDGHHEHPRPRSAFDQIALCQQHQLEKYRCDFFLTGYHDNAVVRSIVVEMDGHEFHERTKEQARYDRSRDRTVQRHGHRILRFTGSEVYADPFRCAQEAVESALGLDTPKP